MMVAAVAGADLPAHWRMAPLGELCDIEGGSTPRSGVPEYWDGDIVWVTPSDLGRLRGREIVASERRITRAGYDSCSTKLVQPGAVIMSSRAPIGHLAIAGVPLCTNQGCKTFVPRGNVSAAYLYFVLRRFMGAIREMGSGSTFDEVSKSKLGQFEIPLPPLDEQRRIVAALDATLGRLDAARARLQRVPEILKRYRAALLKAACEGRLVPTEAELARAEGRDYEPADALLARILDERRAKWEQAELAKYATAGKPPPTNWRAKYKAPAPPDTSDLPELPEGWCWTSVEAVLREPLANGRSVRDAVGGFPVLRLSALKDGRIDVAERKEGEWTAMEAAPYIIRRDDFLIARGNGSLSLVGRGALVEGEPDPVAHPDTLIRVRLAASACLPRFFRIYWNSELNRRWLEQTARTSAGIFKVSQEDIRPALLPLPPLAEQRRIVAAVERQRAAVERIEAAAAANLRRCEQMREAVLAKAFRGELV